MPGKPDESLLIEALNYDSFEMPPKGKLKAEIIADFKKWIEMGAPDPRKVGDKPTAPAKPDIDFAKARKFWSFQPPQKSPPPVVKQSEWIQRPLDAFVLKRIEEAKLAPAAPADRRIWLRRVTFDLSGLPPTPEEVRGLSRG